MNKKLWRIFLFAIFLAAASNSVALAASALIKPCSGVFEYEGEAYFCAVHQDKGKEVFRSSGEPGGTVLLRDIDPGPGSSSPSGFFKLNDFLYFTAENTASGLSIWRTDGTSENTTLIASLIGGHVGDVEVVIRDEERVILKTQRDQLYVSDGTSAGTKKLDAIITGGLSSSLSYIPESSYFLEGNSLFFVTFDKLYKLSIDENVSSEIFSFPIEFDGCGFSTFLDESSSASGRLVVRHSPSPCSNDQSVWVSDGTRSGTRTLDPSNVRILANFDNGVLLCSQTDSAYFKLSGSTLVAIRGGFDDGSFCQDSQIHHIHNGVVYFSQVDANDLWVKDLTTAAPKVIASSIEYLGRQYESIGNELYMVASEVSGGIKSSLFRLDSAQGAFVEQEVFNNQRLIGLHRVDNQLFMLFSETVRISSGGSNFRNDLILKKLQRGSSSVVVRRLIGQGYNGWAQTWNEGGRLYFQFEYQGDLWHSNGTSQSTYRLSYFVPDKEVTPEQEAAAKVIPNIYLLLIEDEATSP